MAQLKDELAYYAHPSAYVDNGAVIGRGSKIWHFCRIMTGAVLGDGCNLGQNVFVAGSVVLGNNVKVQNNVSLYDGVLCGDDVFIGPSAVFTNVRNPRAAVNRRGEYQTTIVEKGATIGANATIVCGVRIGAYAFIGAGAVVTHTVLPYSLVVGAPAKAIGWMSEAGLRLHFDTQGLAACPQTGKIYRLIDGTVHPD